MNDQEERHDLIARIVFHLVAHKTPTLRFVASFVERAAIGADPRAALCEWFATVGGK